MGEMNRFVRYTILILSTFVILGGSAFAQGGPHGGRHGTSDRPSETKCPVCGMYTAIFTDWNCLIEFKDGTMETFDGAKYYLDMGKYAPQRNLRDVVSISLKDYYSKAWVNASRAYFVIWSNIYGPMGHEPIPFREEADAKRFLKEHKGKAIIGFRDVSLELLTSLDNPE
jgi:copper chaperone NosL